MLRRFAVAVALSAAGAAICGWTATGPENEIRDFIAGWNAAYTGLDADASPNWRRRTFNWSTGSGTGSVPKDRSSTANSGP
jgi:hypothetical protein